MSILLERNNKGHRPTEVWLCNANNDNQIEQELQDLPKATPPGSFALITTNNGLIVYIKSNTGDWKLI